MYVILIRYIVAQCSALLCVIGFVGFFVVLVGEVVSGYGVFVMCLPDFVLFLSYVG